MGELDDRLMEEWADQLEAGIQNKDEAIEMTFNLIKKLDRKPEIIESTAFSITIALKCQHGGYQEVIALDNIDEQWIWEETGWDGPETEECTDECRERLL